MSTDSSYSNYELAVKALALELAKPEYQGLAAVLAPIGNAAGLFEGDLEFYPLYEDDTLNLDAALNWADLERTDENVPLNATAITEWLKTDPAEREFVRVSVPNAVKVARMPGLVIAVQAGLQIPRSWNGLTTRRIGR